MEKTVTIEQVLDWRPCYTREQVEELFAGRETMGWRDIAALPISAEHRCWALLHKEFLEERQLYLLGADIAELVLPIYEERYPGNPLPRNAIEAARQFARGEIDEYQLDAARSAAWSAANVADSYAANYAASVAALSAARSSSRSTAWAAVWFAARSTEWFISNSDARSTASVKIMQIICRHLEIMEQ